MSPMLSSLPFELLWYIWDGLDISNDKNALVLTCRRFYSTFLLQSACGPRVVMVWAASTGREACIRKLLEYGVNPSLCDQSHLQKGIERWGSVLQYYMIPPLDVPMSSGQERIKPSPYGYSVWVDFTPLVRAAERGNAPIVKLLLDAGANVNAHGHALHLPIMAAVRGGHTAIVATLLAAGADPYIPIHRWVVLLAHASAYGHIKIVKLLLGEVDGVLHGASDYTPHQRRAALGSAVRGGHKGIVRLILETGVDVNTPTYWRDDLLIIAGKQGSEDIVNLLLHFGADVVASDDSGRHLLHKTIFLGYLALFITLLNRGVCPHTAVRGDPPLVLAIEHDHPDMVKALLEHHVDPETQTKDGETPLLLAANFSRGVSIKHLLRHGANPNIIDREGYNPPCLAVRRAT